MNDICIGILTANREELFKELLTSIDIIIPKINKLIILENSNIDIKYTNKYIFNYTNIIYDYIEKNDKVNIAKNKNIILKHFLETNCDYLFLLEDDIAISDISIFNDYIELSKKSGIEHFCYGYGGDCNIEYINNKIRFKYKPLFSKKNDIIFFKHCVGMFCFYTRNILEKIGLFDENFDIGFDHIDHSFRIMSHYKLQFLYPDYKYSYLKIKDNDRTLNKSILRKTTDFWNKQKICINKFNNKYNLDYLNNLELYYNSNFFKNILL